MELRLVDYTVSMHGGRTDTESRKRGKVRKRMGDRGRSRLHGDARNLQKQLANKNW